MLITFLIAVVVVALFMLGLSITLIRKGRNMQTDVGDNDDMKRLGIQCTLEQMGGQSCALSCSASCAMDGTPPLCDQCDKNANCADHS